VRARAGWLLLFGMAGCAGPPPVAVPRATWMNRTDDPGIAVVTSGSTTSLPGVPRSDLANQVVQLVAYGREGDVSVGAGVVLCRAENSAYILSAMHVLTGEEQAGVPGGLRQLERLERVEVSFRGGKPKVERTIEELGTQFEPKQDLVLFSIPIPRGHALSTARIGSSRNLATGAPVVTIGHDAHSGSGAWRERDGTLDAASGPDALLYAPDVPAGYSGGPLYDGNGWLLGINRAVDDVGRTRATRIETVFESIRRRVPKNCNLESAS
jgi:S1-C subfamily serine protease